jgi:hypothetical protein
MKAPRPWLFLKIYLLVIGSVGCVALSFLTAVSCAIMGGCDGDEFLSTAAQIMIKAWPLILLLLMPLGFFGGAVIVSRKEEKNEK